MPGPRHLHGLKRQPQSPSAIGCGPKAQPLTPSIPPETHVLYRTGVAQPSVRSWGSRSPHEASCLTLLPQCSRQLLPTKDASFPSSEVLEGPSPTLPISSPPQCPLTQGSLREADWARVTRPEQMGRERPTCAACRGPGSAACNTVSQTPARPAGGSASP